MSVLLFLFASVAYGDAPPDFVKAYGQNYISKFIGEAARPYVTVQFTKNESGESVIVLKTYNGAKGTKDRAVLSSYEINFSEGLGKIPITPQTQAQEFLDGMGRIKQPALVGEAFVSVEDGQLIPGFDYRGQLRSLLRGDPVLHPIFGALAKGEKISLTPPQLEVIGGPTKQTKQPGLIDFYAKHLQSGAESPLWSAVVLPTGIGKTVVGIEYVDKVRMINGGKQPLVIFILENKQILDDVAEKFQKKYASESIVRLYGESSRADIHGFTQVILATRTTGNNRIEEILDYASRYDGPVVMYRDEAHATGRLDGELQKILDRFKMTMTRKDQVIDLSATMWHDEDPRMLRRYNGNVATSFLTPDEYEQLIRGENVPRLARIQLLRAIGQGWLSPLKNITFITEETQGEFKQNYRRTLFRDQDRIPRIMGKTGGRIENVDIENITPDQVKALRDYITEFHQPIIDAIANDIRRQIQRDSSGRVGEYDRGLIFVPTILHAEIYNVVLNKMFSGENFEFRMAHSKMKGGLVNQVGENIDWLNDLDRSKKTRHKYLINVSIAKEGLDIPGVNRIIMAATTDSIKTLLQIFGRATRLMHLKTGIRLTDFSGSFLAFFKELPESILQRFVSTPGMPTAETTGIEFNKEKRSLGQLISLELTSAEEEMRAVAAEEEARLAEAAPETKGKEVKPGEAEPPKQERKIKPRTPEEELFQKYRHTLPDRELANQRLDQIVKTMLEVKGWKIPADAFVFLNREVFNMGLPWYHYMGDTSTTNEQWERQLEEVKPLIEAGTKRVFEVFSQSNSDSIPEEYRLHYDFFSKPDNYRLLEAYVEFHWLMGTRDGRALLASHPDIGKAAALSHFTGDHEFEVFKHNGRQYTKPGLPSVDGFKLDDPRWVIAQPEIDQLIDRHNVVLESLSPTALRGLPAGVDWRRTEIPPTRTAIIANQTTGTTAFTTGLNTSLFDTILVHQGIFGMRMDALDLAEDPYITRKSKPFGKKDVNFGIPTKIVTEERYLFGQALLRKISPPEVETARPVTLEMMREPILRILTEVKEGKRVAPDFASMNEAIRAGSFMIHAQLQSVTGWQPWEVALVYDGMRRTYGDPVHVGKKASEPQFPELLKLLLEVQIAQFEAGPERLRIFTQPKMEWLLNPAQDLMKDGTFRINNHMSFGENNYGYSQRLIGHPVRVFTFLPMLLPSFDQNIIDGFGYRSDNAVANLKEVLEGTRARELEELKLHELFGMDRPRTDLNLPTKELVEKEHLRRIFRITEPRADDGFLRFDPSRLEWLKVVDYLTARLLYDRHFGEGKFNEGYSPSDPGTKKPKSVVVEDRAAERAEDVREQFKDFNPDKGKRKFSSRAEDLVAKLSRTTGTTAQIRDWLEAPRNKEATDFLKENWRLLSLPWEFYVIDGGLSVEEIESFRERARTLSAAGFAYAFESFQTTDPDLLPEDFRAHYEFFNKPENYKMLSDLITFHAILATEDGRKALARQAGIVAAMDALTILARHGGDPKLVGSVPELLLDPRWVNQPEELQKGHWTSRYSQNDDFRFPAKAIHPRVFLGHPADSFGRRSAFPSLLRAAAMTSMVNPNTPANRFFHDYFLDPDLLGDRDGRSFLRGSYRRVKVANMDQRSQGERAQPHISSNLMDLEVLLWLQDLYVKIADKQGKEAVRDFEARLLPLTQQLIEGETLRPLTFFDMKGGYHRAMPQGLMSPSDMEWHRSGPQDIYILTELARWGKRFPIPEMRASTGQAFWLDSWHRLPKSFDSQTYRNSDTIRGFRQTMLHGIVEQSTPSLKPFRDARGDWLREPFIDLVSDSEVLEQLSQKNPGRDSVMPESYMQRLMGGLRYAYGPGTIALTEKTPLVAFIPLIYAYDRGDDITKYGGITAKGLEIIELIRPLFEKKYGEAYRGLDLDSAFKSKKKLQPDAGDALIPTHVRLGLDRSGEEFKVSQVRARWIEIIDYHFALRALEEMTGEGPERFDNRDVRKQFESEPEKIDGRNQSFFDLTTSKKMKGSIRCNAFL